MLTIEREAARIRRMLETMPPGTDEPQLLADLDALLDQAADRRAQSPLDMLRKFELVASGLLAGEMTPSSTELRVIASVLEDMRAFAGTGG